MKHGLRSAKGTRGSWQHRSRAFVMYTAGFLADMNGVPVAQLSASSCVRSTNPTACINRSYSVLSDSELAQIGEVRAEFDDPYYRIHPILSAVLIICCL